jgi:acyl-CoA reductase-like NAD-dependent aldehyde dehydrogenase
MERWRHWIGGDWASPHGEAWFVSDNPSTGRPLAELARGDATDIDRAVAAAEAAFVGWAARDGLQRSRLLARVATRLAEEAERLARMESEDTGKPLREARTDVQVAARYFEFYAGLADKFGGATIPVPGPYLDYTLREPVGVVAHIIPWNYPLQIGARAIAAPLAVGNTVVLKPAEEASLSVLEMARLATEEGLPPGAVNVVTGFGEEAGAALARHPGIGHLTFTGSRDVGRLVAQAAAGHIVPVTLELGGKSPHLVFAGANLDRAVPVMVRSFLQNAGQTCSAGSRILVDRRVAEELEGRLEESLRRVTVGPGVDDPDLGPVISARQKAEVERRVAEALEAGLQVAAAGSVPGAAAGYFVPPLVLSGATPTHQIFQEEVFGPVATLTVFDDEEDAIRLANATAYGLVAAVWTADVGQAHRVARAIRAGQVFINAYGAGGGVEMPFGGYGQSGYGREKGVEALFTYTQLKNVAVYLGD